jgi:hypothetical protein
MRRFLLLAFFAAIVLGGLAACKEPAASSGSEGIRPSDDIVISNVTRYQASDSSAGAGGAMLVCTFRYTNKLGRDFVPRIEKFTLEDAAHRRFAGQENGDAGLVGVGNDRTILKADEARRYTAGFRVPQDFVGIMYYDPT